MRALVNRLVLNGRLRKWAYNATAESVYWSDALTTE